MRPSVGALEAAGGGSGRQRPICFRRRCGPSRCRSPPSGRRPRASGRSKPTPSINPITRVLPRRLLVAAAAAGIGRARRCAASLWRIPTGSRKVLRHSSRFGSGAFSSTPSHYAGAQPAGSIALQIDAATAFGSGEHGSTYGCLSAIDWLAPSLGVDPALDVGCGSGILAIAIAKLGRSKVVATDIDPEAVRVCRENARLNAVGGRIEAICSATLRNRRIGSVGGIPSYRGQYSGPAAHAAGARHRMFPAGRRLYRSVGPAGAAGAAGAWRLPALWPDPRPPDYG